MVGRYLGDIGAKPKQQARRVPLVVEPGECIEIIAKPWETGATSRVAGKRLNAENL